MVHDAVVIGGGVIGLSCAWRLGQAGLNVLLIDRRQVGGGASGASLGALVPAIATHHGPTQMLQRASLRAFPTFAAELRTVTGVDVAYTRCGLLEIMHNEARLANAQREIELALREWTVGERPADAAIMSIISNEEARELAPGVIFDAHGVRRCRASALVDVQALIRALELACRGAGVEIRTGVEVTDLALERDERVTGVVCGSEHVPARAVLVAAGAWTCRLHPLLARYAPIRPAKGQALVLQSKPPAMLVKRQKAYLAGGGAALLVGSTTEPEAGFDEEPTAEGVARLRAGAASLAPHLAKVEVVRNWAGLRPESLSRRPHLGPIPGISGLFVAAGHYKTGVGHAPITAEIMTALVKGDEPAWSIAPFAAS
jgi:glycine oxidase